MKKNHEREKERSQEKYPELNHVETDVLIKEVENQLGDAVVGPGAVDEEEPPQEPELGDGVIRGPDRLQTLLAADAHANVGSLDHSNVVGPVANREGDGLEGVLNQQDHLRLLERGDTAADHRFAPLPNVQHQPLHVILQGKLERLAVNNKAQTLQDHRGKCSAQEEERRKK